MDLKATTMSFEGDFPLYVFREAIKTVIGWMVAVFAMMAFGLGVGLWVGIGQFPGFVVPLAAVFLAIFLSIFSPLILCAYFATLVTWAVFVLAEIDSVPLRVAGLLALLVIWVGVGYWIGHAVIPALGAA